jgi:phosphatidylserine decarboxylase
MRMPIDLAGWPFIAGTLLVALGVGAFSRWWWSLPFVVLAAFFVFFFRDPERQVVAGDNLVLSPADGRVMVAGPVTTLAPPPGEWQQISIFLSPMDVHVNRVPASGRVTRVSYTPGKFLAAYKGEAATLNERSEIWIDTGPRDANSGAAAGPAAAAGRFVVARQIVGVLARRVVCRLEPGAEVKAGDRYGVMKFGSRMDIFVPVSAELKARVGDYVRGAESVLAVLH